AGLGTLSQRPGSGWAMAAGAATSSRAATATSTRTARAQARLRSWCIGELVELFGRADQVGGGGRGGDVADRDRPVADRALDLLPAAAAPAQGDGGDAPALADRHRALGPADRPGDAGHPHAHAGRGVAVVVDPPDHRGCP